MRRFLAAGGLLLSLGAAAGWSAPSRVVRLYHLARDAFLEGRVEHAYRLYDVAARVPPGTPELQARAVARVNHHRKYAMLVPLVPDPRVARAAQAHADYLARHAPEGELSLEDAHTERRGRAGFTGVGPAERIAAAGLRGGATEGVTTVRDPEEAIDHLVNSVYHRSAMLRQEARTFGIGRAARVVVNLGWGRGDADEGELWTYPGPGQAEVPPRFPAGETPDPLPDDPYPVGPPLSVGASGGAPELLDASLEGPGGASRLRVLREGTAPRADLLGDWIYLVPEEPLVPGGAYAARVRVRVRGEERERRWRFRVGEDVPGEELYELRVRSLSTSEPRPEPGDTVRFRAQVEASHPELLRVRWSVNGEVVQDGEDPSFTWAVPGPGWFEVRATAHYGVGIEAQGVRAEVMHVPGPGQRGDAGIEGAMPSLDEMRRRSPGEDLWAIRISRLDVDPPRVRAGDAVRFEVGYEVSHEAEVSVRWKVDGAVVREGAARTFTWEAVSGSHTVAADVAYAEHPDVHAEAVVEFRVP